MSRPPTDLPERLLDADATDFERRLLGSARRKGPPLATSARLAQALGVTVTVAAPVAAATTLHAATASKAAAAGTTAAGTTAVWPWVSAGIVALAVAGAVVGPRAWRAPASTPPSPSVSVPAPRSPETPPALPDQPTASGERPSPPFPRPAEAALPRRPVISASRIALLDAARAAAAANAGRRALELLRRYEEKYPAGSFRPEAVALKVEVLVKLGRTDEARALAERFVAQHRGSLLARRVAELARLTEP